MLKLKRLGITFFAPNYAFFERFNEGDIVVDVGIGDKPDFSAHLMSRYNLKCIGVDPTLKHAETLRKFELENPLFRYLPLAVGQRSEFTTFFESQINVSGSLLKNHINIMNDPIISYPVRVVTISDLIEIIDAPSISIMKLDIEGAEYRLIKTLEQSALDKISQLIVEFHHDTISRYSWKDTVNCINQIKDVGMNCIVYNGRDCLFYWD